MLAPKRILPSSTPPPQRPPPPPATRKHVLRVSQACTSCRRQKMRCEGADNPPCVRCRVANTECIFEKASKPQHMDPTVHERLAEMEHEIETFKATQRQMQTTLNEILTELRCGSGRPLPSSPTENPVASCSDARMELPATQPLSSSSISCKPHMAAACTTQSGAHRIPSNSHSAEQLSADIAKSSGSLSPPPTGPNQVSRKRKHIDSGEPGPADDHRNSSKRSRGESNCRDMKLPHHHDMPPPPPESKEPDLIDKGILTQHDAEQLFALYAYLPPLWS